MTTRFERVWVDGCLGGTVPIDDRGLRYGEQVFETMAAASGRVPLWPLHWQRLTQAAKKLAWPALDQALIEQELHTAIAHGQPCLVRLSLTGGSGGHGYWPPQPRVLRRLIQILAWPHEIELARRCGLRCTLQALPTMSDDSLRGLKHGNRLQQVLAAQAAQAQGVDEAILCDAQGKLLEGISANLLVVVNGQTLTPAQPLVDGVGLAWLRARCPDIRPSSLDRDVLSQADEVVMVNSVSGVRPVIEVDGQPLPIGSHCLRWQQLWSEHLL